MFVFLCFYVSVSFVFFLVCFSSKCKTRRRDGCTMRQRAYTCVNSCLPCPQVPLSVLEPADERAGGRLQRLDQLGVSVCPPPVCAGWRGKCGQRNLHVYVHIYMCIWIHVNVCVGVQYLCVCLCAYECVRRHTFFMTSYG